MFTVYYLGPSLPRPDGLSRLKGGRAKRRGCQGWRALLPCGGWPAGRLAIRGGWPFGEAGHSERLALRGGWPFGEETPSPLWGTPPFRWESPCGVRAGEPVGLAGRLAIRGGDPLPPLGYSPFQVGESMRSVGAGELFYLAGRVALRGGDPLPLRGLFHYSFPLALPQGRGVLPLSGGRVRAGCGLALLLLDPLCPSGISPFMGRAMRGVGGCGLF